MINKKWYVEEEGKLSYFICFDCFKKIKPIFKEIKENNYFENFEQENHENSNIICKPSFVKKPNIKPFHPLCPNSKSMKFLVSSIIDRELLMREKNRVSLLKNIPPPITYRNVPNRIEKNL